MIFWVLMSKEVACADPQPHHFLPVFHSGQVLSLKAPPCPQMKQEDVCVHVPSQVIVRNKEVQVCEVPSREPHLGSAQGTTHHSRYTASC